MAPQSRERDFDKIGGLKEHIQALKEMIIYPLLYRELFEVYGIEAPRGVLFHGPPGTGKTLIAGAVATECSKSSSRRVSFYTRKGADCLNKYVGETEKHLQNLFSQAYNTRPSIIFFDEIDGLVPTRSEAQEQVHASVVSTLLALMDGLDSKSEVFVIGATNRIDMIDPALRRPGRFDRELYFPLPPLESRVQIFRIHTRNWKRKPSQSLIYKLASECTGYCGADIQFLCTQAVMNCFRRNFPQITDTSKKYQINYRSVQKKRGINLSRDLPGNYGCVMGGVPEVLCELTGYLVTRRVEDEDFLAARESMVPASQRTYILPSRPLSPELEPLLRRSLDNSLDHIHRTCPFKFLFLNREDFTKNRSFSCPRALLFGREGQGHVTHIAPAILHCFDHLPVTILDMASISEDGTRISDSNAIVHKLDEARQNMPSIIYLKNISSWWHLIDDPAKQVIVTFVESLDTSNIPQIFFFGTIYGSCYEDLPSEIKKLFPKSKTFEMSDPTTEERTQFFGQLLLKKSKSSTKLKQERLVPDHLDYASFSGLDLDSDLKLRRSLRQRGLDVEFLGLNAGSRPRLGSYFRRYVHSVPVCRLEGVRNSKTRSAHKSLRGYRIDEFEAPLKKLKVEIDSESASCSKASIAGSCETYSTLKCKVNVKVDTQSLERIMENAVEATSTCQVNSIIRLYEELEIIMLRYSSTWDRSLLKEELEREISVFVPT